MATGKRFYWIKLHESFMNSDTVDYLMSQPDGANYVVLYQMLCLKTINTEGRLAKQIGEVIIPFDVEKIQRDCKWFSADTIRVAMSLYKGFGLIYEDVDGTLVVANHKEIIDSETDWAKQKREQIERKEVLELQSGNDVESGVENLHTEIRVKSLELRDKSLETKGNGNTSYSCLEPEKSVSKPKETKPDEPIIIEMDLRGGETFGVTKSQYDKYVELYPAVDVMQELRKMVGWLDSNPDRRKGKSGIKRFITNWLSKEQDRGGSYRNNYQQPSQPKGRFDRSPGAEIVPWGDEEYI